MPKVYCIYVYKRGNNSGRTCNNSCIKYKNEKMCGDHIKQYKNKHEKDNTEKEQIDKRLSDIEHKIDRLSLNDSNKQKNKARKPVLKKSTNIMHPSNVAKRRENNIYRQAQDVAIHKAEMEGNMDLATYLRRGVLRVYPANMTR